MEMAEIELVPLRISNDHRSRGDGRGLVGAAKATEG